MNLRKSHLLLPVVLSAGSFLGLVAIVLLTNPVQSISYAVVFFGVLLTMLVSLGHLLVHALTSGGVSPKARRRIIIVAVAMVIFLMFRSAGSLSWVDLTVMILLAGGLLFYSGRM